MALHEEAKQTITALQRLADIKDPKALYYLGEYYYCDLGLFGTPDAVNAAYYFYLAAEHRTPEPLAWIRMHQIYTASHGVSADIGLSLRYQLHSEDTPPQTDDILSLVGSPEKYAY